MYVPFFPLVDCSYTLKMEAAASAKILVTLREVLTISCKVPYSYLHPETISLSGFTRCFVWMRNFIFCPCKGDVWESH